MKNKRLKKVNLPKEPTKGPFVRPEAPADLKPAVFEAPPAPVGPSEFAQRLLTIEAGIRAKQEAAKASFGPPVHPPIPGRDVTSDYVVAGKTVAQWDKLIEKRIEEAGKGAVVDFTDLPDWVSWAVRHWHLNGKPTPASKTLAQVTKLREEAEKLATFAALDKDKAKAQNAYKAKKLTTAAQKKLDKAAELFKQADELARNFKGKA